MKRIITVLLLLISCSTFAQSKKLWLHYADQYYKAKDYSSALNYYLKTLDDTSVMNLQIRPYEPEISNQKLGQLKNKQGSEVPMRSYVLHRIAMCQKYIFDYSAAIPSFKNSLTTGHFPEDEYFLGYSYMQIKEYDTAVIHFEKYLQNDKRTDSLAKCADRDMIGCYYAKDVNNVKSEVIITMLDTSSVNKGTSNFAAIYWDGYEKIIFTSARTGGVLLDPEKQQSEYLCDLYWAEKNEAGWSTPRNFGRPVNTGLHDGAGSMSIDGFMYFTRWSDLNRNDVNIYEARMMNNMFFEAYKLDSSVNVPGYQSKNPFISMDGKQLFYSSNRPGGSGGFDIWVCDIDENGHPVNPRNLGPTINSEYDEVTPFLHHVSSTLFFSSNGHNSTGGLDIFKSYYNPDDSTYATPGNIGLPFNSPQDDAYFTADRFLKHGYFSSDREPCDGGHCYDIYEFTNSPIAFKLTGFVYNAETDDIIPNALLTFNDVNGQDEPIFLTTDENGFYSQDLKQEQELFIKAKKTKFFADAATVTTFGLTESKTLEQDFFLRPIPAGEIEIPGIEYDFNKATLRPKSKEILDQLYDFLMLNNDLVVEIKSHTDCRGSDAYNMKLSQERAQSCVDYLISKGIARERLIPQGYGETEPLFKCDDIEAIKKSDPDKYEEQHQRNRRTAFRVLKQS
ncbi:MAG: OmpA family protein [Flavobacteriales bacterium]|nr:OmpA family protein [Flavobacteriales bacterium]